MSKSKIGFLYFSISRLRTNKTRDKRTLNQNPNFINHFFLQISIKKMKFEHYLKKLHDSSEYKKFKSHHKKSYLCAGFFVLDYETGKDMHQLDFSLPNGRVATFFLDEKVKSKISSQAIKKELPELKTEIKTDLDALKGIVEDEMKNRTVTEKIKKIIAILHVMDNKTIWNLQCILDGLTLLNVHVDDADKTVLKFEKHSLLEMMKPLANMQIQPTQETKISPEDLEKLKKSIEEMKKQQENKENQPKEKPAKKK